MEVRPGTLEKWQKALSWFERKILKKIFEQLVNRMVARNPNNFGNKCRTVGLTKSEITRQCTSNLKEYHITEVLWNKKE